MTQASRQKLQHTQINRAGSHPKPRRDRWGNLIGCRRRLIQAKNVQDPASSFATSMYSVNEADNFPDVSRPSCDDRPELQGGED
jgi:hypothetical protein